MTVIVEGGDRVGKSTVCRYLIDKGLSYYHFDYPRTEKVSMIYDNYFSMSTGKPKCSHVYDRALFSEYAYSRYYNRKSDMDIDMINMFEEKFKKNDIDGYAVILYLENSPDQNLKLLEQEGEGKINSIDDILKLRRYYYEILSHAVLPIFTYNYQFQDISQIYKIMQMMFTD